MTALRYAMFLLVFVLEFGTSVAFGGQRYTAPSAKIDRVSAPPGLKAFLIHIRETAIARASAAELEALFSETTEWLVGGISVEALSLRSYGNFRPGNAKIVEAAAAMDEGEHPASYRIADQATEIVWRFLAGNLDQQMIFSRQPGQPQRFCLSPVVVVDIAAMALAEKQAGSIAGRFMATIKPVNIYQKPQNGGKLLERLAAGRVVKVTELGNEGWAEVAAPSGQAGFSDQTAFVAVYADRLCFGLRADGSWQISTIIKRGL